MTDDRLGWPHPIMQCHSMMFNVGFKKGKGCHSHSQIHKQTQEAQFWSDRPMYVTRDVREKRWTECQNLCQAKWTVRQHAGNTCQTWSDCTNCQNPKTVCPAPNWKADPECHVKSNVKSIGKDYVRVVSSHKMINEIECQTLCHTKCQNECHIDCTETISLSLNCIQTKSTSAESRQYSIFINTLFYSGALMSAETCWCVRMSHRKYVRKNVRKNSEIYIYTYTHKKLKGYCIKRHIKIRCQKQCIRIKARMYVWQNCRLSWSDSDRTSVCIY